MTCTAEDYTLLAVTWATCLSLVYFGVQLYRAVKRVREHQVELKRNRER